MKEEIGRGAFGCAFLVVNKLTKEKCELPAGITFSLLQSEARDWARDTDAARDRRVSLEPREAIQALD